MKNHVVFRVLNWWNLEETQIVSTDFDVIGVCTNWDSVRAIIAKSMKQVRQIIGDDNITYEGLSIMSYKTVENRHVSVEYKVCDFEEMDTLL